MRYICIVGEPALGFTHYGPFEGLREAADFAAEAGKILKGGVWVTPLKDRWPTTPRASPARITYARKPGRRDGDSR